MERGRREELPPARDRMGTTRVLKLAYEHGLSQRKRKIDNLSARKKKERAKVFLMLIGELYGMEKAYKAEGLTAGEIKERRNSAETNRVIADLCCRLNDMLNVKDTLGDLMLKAVNYLQSFWKQLMAWRNDGNYSIDNNLAERSIRPLTVQRKNSMMFGSETGSRRPLVRIDNTLAEKEISTIYHTIIETCKLAGKSQDVFRPRCCSLRSRPRDARDRGGAFSWSASSMRSILVEPITRTCFR